MRLDAIILLLFVCLFGSFKLRAQTYNYTYTDPCTGNDKTIIVPINGNVTIGYYGSIGSFSYNDFTNGNFESWASNIFSQYGTNSPCSEIVGLGTAVNVTQSTALNVIGILNSLSTISDIAGSTNILGGSVTSVSNAGGGKGEGKKENKKNNSSESTNNTQTQETGSQNQTNNTGSQPGGTQNTTSGSTNGGSESQPEGGQNTTQGSANGGSGSTNGGSGSTNGGSGSQPEGGQNTGNTSTPNTQQGPGNTGNTNTQQGSGNTGNSGTTNTQSGQANTNGGGTSGQSQTPGNNNQQGEQQSNPSNTQGTQQGQQNNQSSGNGESSNNPNGNTGNTGNSGNSTGSGGSNEQTQEGQPQPDTKEEEGGQTNITAGASTTVKSTPTSKEGGKPTVVASADFVGFNFRNSEVRTGAKATGGYTAMRWDGKRSYGAMADYTSALKGPNVTAFYAWIRPKSIVLTSGTLTIGFEGNRSLYGTFAAGQMFNITKPKNLKLLYMATVSYGSVYRETFLGTALIAGGTYDFRIGKRFDIKLMNLLVYAPYVSYYNDVVLKSPYVMLPSIGTNIKITKKFKFNINAGGAWDLKTSALNYTITCGTRLVVGQ